MDLELTGDQVDLNDLAEQMLKRNAPLSLARELLEGSRDTSALWAGLAELGWYSVGLDHDDPFGIPGLCLLAERCGAHAAPTLLVDTAVAARVITSTEGALADDLREGVLTVALGVVEPNCDWSLVDLATRVDRTEDGRFLLTGTKLDVHHARSCDRIAVVALLDHEPALVVIAPDSEGCMLADDPGFDRGARICRVQLDRVVVGPESVIREPAALVRALRVGAVATAAEGLGAAGAAFEMAVAYSRERHQFGRAIGSFQALQHLMADLHALRETAWATILYAAAVLDSDRDDAAETVAIAKAHGSRTMKAVVEGALQVLGGVAFTWEHDVHLLQRRVLECERRFGDAIHHEAGLGQIIAARVV